ncbi:TPA: hypothetical protein NG672_002658 [Vibrio parahaemolyticus]|uniref:hypothetical protein n=1 Tax=Vibrio parahaemolyticus TaxID=670 RepID=UPI001122AE95|nr:hypothetical protein [Vibrio parahaemolyticus]MBE5147992.1 hypothetical protein [Vibrio parahaemolyticus]TOE76762.1 hypothetical protein CGJ36_09070 [Vibrio parahaemolyticus]HCE2126241.1 hypothetical protein [Vibrio parahaemolyticus]HCE3635241.1 hypothetical protein [Vibrio parahaemolyticus]HCG5114599.1 hypothetical protein [Vibrio parahaemolyticus]
MRTLNAQNIGYLGNYILTKGLASQYNCDKHILATGKEDSEQPLIIYQQNAKKRIKELQGTDLSPYVYNLVNCQDQTEVTIAGNLLEFMAISESAVIFGQFNHPTWDKVTHDLRRLMTDGVHKGVCYHKEKVSEEVADRILAPTQPYILDALLKEFELPPTEKDAIVIEIYDPTMRKHPLCIDIMHAIHSILSDKIDVEKNNSEPRQFVEHRFNNFDYTSIVQFTLE